MVSLYSQDVVCTSVEDCCCCCYAIDGRVLLYRDPGVIGLLPYASEGRFTMYYGLIVDGYHTHDASIRLAYAMHPKGAPI